MVIRMYKRLVSVVSVITILALIITGCTSQASNIGLAREGNKKTVASDFVVTEVGSYDSVDTAVVLSIAQDIGYVTFMNIATGRQYTLSYDGTTYVKDKYEGAMSMSQIGAGDIVDITFLKSKKKLTSMQLSPQAWEFSNVENYNLGGANKTATIGSNTYSLPDDVVVISEGERTEVMNVVNKDVLTIKGIDHKICSINVNKGHGYLRLSNEQALVGGWIEVGNAVVTQITENMMLTVPEGSYEVILSKDNASTVKNVVIERNREVILNAGELDIVQDKVGKIIFSVEPVDATVSIDGNIADISKEVELPYGIHHVKLEAEGYKTMAKYIQVGSEYASLSFTMEPGDDAETEDADSDFGDKGDSGNDDEVQSAVTENQVYIDAPVGVEVYLDGNYMGICPVNFKKVTGSHTVALRKTGYQSKSYTIYLYDDGQDITYSFTDLEKEDSGSSGNKNSSSKSTKNTSEGSSSIEKDFTSYNSSKNSSSDDTVSGNGNK
ncbi:MAG: PEGA domain-containing protein [Lachnospiraceae bacterium]|nr:PEGA domain-containing protein [Lachnospiraceae bacterium]